MNWWSRNQPDWEVLGFMATLVLLLLMILWMPVPVKAEPFDPDGCLIVQVPPGAVLREMDGDTIPLFHFGAGGQVKIRVQGVDTPERKHARWNEARAFTREWLQQGPFVVKTCGQASLDRIVGDVYRYVDGEKDSLADALKDVGLDKHHKVE